jgi:hypothetical protein
MLLPILSDLRVLTAVLVGLLGLTLLRGRNPRSWAYMRWLAGAALLFGATQLLGRLVDLFLPLPAVVLSALALLAWAAGAGLAVADLRLLTPVPVTVVYVMVLALVMQRDARLLAEELASRERAEAGLKALSEALEHPRATQVVQAHALPTVAADASLLRHVSSNLSSSALKFGREHSDLRVQVRARPEKAGQWRIELVDNGPGFEPERAHALFQPFARLAGAAAPGTGLGLTIVRRAVERHGGEVGASAQPGRGATFWFSLPAASAA